jgi:hypothetical protein
MIGRTRDPIRPNQEIPSMSFALESRGLGTSGPALPTPRRLPIEPVRLLEADAITVSDVEADRRTAAGSRLFGPGWPLQWLLCGFPLWWVLGLNTLVFPLAAVPMAIELRRRARSAPLRWPSASWLWVLFLVWQVLGLALLNISPPGTHPGSTSGRLISTVFTLLEYAGVTVTMLYVANLPRAEVSMARVGRWLGWFFLTVLGGGVLGLLAPRLSFNSAIEFLLPHGIATNSFVVALVHPVTAQVQDVIGTDNGRPSAPFGYTNFWANALAILVLWFIAAWLLRARGRKRVLYVAVVILTIVPVVLSLNRGLWIGVAATLLWLLGRMAFQGHMTRALSVVGAAVVAVGGLALSPLGSVIVARFQNGVSNDIRTFVDNLSLVAVRYSPVLGYGGTRHADGSASSIAVGPSPSCPNCGDVPTGSTGQLWSTLFNQGLIGTVLYFGFFAACLWIYRRERGALAEAALASIMLTFVFALFYSAVPIAPTLTVIAIALLWREREVERREPPATAVIPPRRTLLVQ